MSQSIDVFETPAMSADELRGEVLKLESVMLNMPEHQVTIEPRHYFAEGLYAREILIPKGTVLTGKIHLFEHLNIISQGEISVLTEEGIKRIKAPATIIAKPGIKRVGYAHEDTVWTTIHACKETSADAAEKLLVVDSYEEFEARLKGEIFTESLTGQKPQNAELPPHHTREQQIQP